MHTRMIIVVHTYTHKIYAYVLTHNHTYKLDTYSKSEYEILALVFSSTGKVL
jgi:hypothetical protein